MFSFFSKKEKEMARRTPRPVLKERYEQSERRLEKACRTGKIANVKRAMASHHTLEYAMLYQTYAKSKGSRR